MLKKIAFAIVAIAILGLGVFGYMSYVSPTRIAFVNFRDFMYADIAEANQSFFVKTEQIRLTDNKLPDLSGYDVIYMFGMGLKLGEEATSQIKQLVSDGVPIFVFGHTTSENDLTTISGKDLKYVEGYVGNGGRKNYMYLLNYSRRVLDGKPLFTDDIAQPITHPSNIFFHLGEDVYFETYDAYQKFYREKGFYKASAPKVVLATTNLSPQNQNSRAPIDALIKSLEKRGMNVYPIASFSKKIEFIKAVDPQLIINIPHGRVATGFSDELAELLKQKNIPVLNPVVVFEPYEEWQSSQRGLIGGLLSQSIVTPELDGVIAPFVIGAQFKNEKGFYVFREIPDRVERFASMTENQLALQKKPNREKRLAIYYYKGPGMNAMVAEGLEIAPSLLNLLRHLKSSGYETGELPKDEHELYERIQREGKNSGAYAKGTFDAYLKDGKPELISADTLRAWMEKDLDPKLREDVVRQYGELPGDYMTVLRDSIRHVAVAKVQFGNVVLLPQPLPAYGEDEFQLIHGAKQAPPYPYIASYLWVQHGFKADALMHFGTHGSFEFTPWKQTALSSLDWSDALIGNLPHIYYYVIGNVGEAMIAKRRSYAALVSHLTQPFDQSGLSSGLVKIHKAINDLSVANGEALKAGYLETIKKLMIETGLHKDLELDSLKNRPLSEEDAERLETYLQSVNQEKITKGLYVLGEPYTEKELRETVRMICVDPIAYSKARLDLLNEKISQAQYNNATFIETHYRKPALALIDQVLGKNKDPKSFIVASDHERLLGWQEKHEQANQDAQVRAMIGMMEQGSGGAKNVDSVQVNELRVKALVIDIASEAKKKAYLLKLDKEKEFERASSLIDRQSLKKAKSVAQYIPEMKEALAIATEPKMLELIYLMQNPANRKLAFDYLKNDEFLKAVALKARAQEDSVIALCLSPEKSKDLFLVFKKDAFQKELEQSDKTGLERLKANLELYHANRDKVSRFPKESKDASAISAVLSGKSSLSALEGAIERVNGKLFLIEEKERQYANAVKSYEEAVSSIQSYYASLKNSPKAELASIVNGLNGGFIAPSPGGDPVFNPATIPTGRNLFAIDAERTPTEEAWKIGKRLGDELLENYRKKHGHYPAKVAFTLWGGEFIRDEGIGIAQVLYLLGVEPVRNSSGRIADIRLIPAEKLGRPRIDIVVQTSGQFRDIGGSRIYLINKAVQLAAAAKDSEPDQNFVAKGSLKAEEVMKKNGLSPNESKKFSNARVFGGVNGNYGTGIMGLVEAGDKWEDEKELAEQYLKNMGAVYTEESWGFFKPGIMDAALQETEMVVNYRSSNTWGPLSLDHVSEFMGGMSATVRQVTGKDPDAWFVDTRSRLNGFVQSADEAIWVEARSTLLNPNYIKPLQEGGSSSAEVFAETFRNVYSWNALKPSAIDDELWNELYQVYVKDRYDLKIEAFFNEKNPYALQEMTAVMLEAVRKGMWKPDTETVKTLANLHVKLVREHKAGCSGFVCDNLKLRDMIASRAVPDAKDAYMAEIAEVRENMQKSGENVKLVKETDEAPEDNAVISDLKIGLIVLLCLVTVAAIIFGIRRRKR